MNWNYQCWFWLEIDGKVTEIFKPHKAGCDEGQLKVNDQQTDQEISAQDIKEVFGK